MEKSVFSLKTAFAALGAGLVARSFLNVGFEAERMNNAMRAATGSSEAAGEAFKFLRGESSRLGLIFQDNIKNYQKLAASAQGTKVSGEEVKNIFSGIGEAATALQLSQEEVNGIFLATSQIMGKGKVQAEELRGQIGERLPGAFTIAARAMGVSQQELSKMLDDGRLMSEEFLPKFAAELRKTFGEDAVAASQSATASINRLKNEWFDFQKTVMEGGVFDYVKAVLAVISEEITNLRETGKLGQWAKESSDAVVLMIQKMIKGFAGLMEILTFVQRAFEGIKFVINKVLEAWAWLVSKILGGYGAIADTLGMDGLAGSLQGLASEFKAVSEVAGDEADKAANKLVELADKQGTYWAKSEELVDRVNKKVEVFKKLNEALAKKPPRPVASVTPGPDFKLLEAQDKAAIARLRETTKTALTKLEGLYEQGKIALESYFAERRALVVKQYDEEIRIAEAAAKREKDATKKTAAESEVFQLRQQREQALLELDQDFFKKRKDLDEKEVERKRILSAQKLRIETDYAVTLSAQFTKELGEMDIRHQEEIARLLELKATKEEIDEAYRNQKLEKDKLMMDQERRLHEYNLQMIAETAAGFGEIFNSLYEMSGKKRKEFFYLSKAAALAEAIVNTSQAVTKALAQGGIWGIAQAAVLGAKGAVEIAKITSQNLAEGGLVAGKSPSATADDKVIGATSGEFMQPVSAVNYYGKGVMEAIRRRAVPKGLLSGFSVPNAKSGGFRFAGGGMVTAATPGGTGMTLEANIINYQDPSQFERAIATNRGKNLLINFIGEHSRTIRRRLA